MAALSNTKSKEAPVAREEEERLQLKAKLERLLNVSFHYLGLQVRGVSRAVVSASTTCACSMSVSTTWACLTPVSTTWVYRSSERCRWRS